MYLLFLVLYIISKPLTACKLVRTTRFAHNKSVCAFLDSYVLISLVTQVFLSVTVNIIGCVRDMHLKKKRNSQQGDAEANRITDRTTLAGN